MSVGMGKNRLLDLVYGSHLSIFLSIPMKLNLTQSSMSNLSVLNAKSNFFIKISKSDDDLQKLSLH